VWLALEAQFLNNHESLVLQLNVRFCVFKQGDISVSDYCCWMMGMADDLRAWLMTFVPWVRSSPIDILFLTFYMA
jgi:hypothetical protein